MRCTTASAFGRSESGKQATLGHVLLGLLNQIWQLAHRHGDVTGPHVIVGLLDSHCAPERLLSRTPQLVLLLLVLCKLKGLATGLLGKALNLSDLLLDTGRSTGELEEERCCLSPSFRCHACIVDALHLVIIEDLDGRDRNTLTNNLAHAISGVADRGETADSNTGRLGFDGDLESGLGDKTKGALRADEEFGKVVASRALARSLPGLDNCAVSEDNCQAKNPLAHGTVAVGVSTAASGTDHATNHGTRAGVGREEEALLTKVVVESLPTHGRLDNNIKILLVKIDDLVHTAKVDGDTLACGSKVALETGTAAVASNGDPASVADLHDLRYFLGS
ncbi:hypothetical protein HG531_002042 [Fusarium graminearum]|nr:hypothetical protein HG531_002042 [Fusarium graminearum]